MDMMSAARLHDVASPFVVDRVPVPTPGDDDVLVRVRACALVPNLKNVAYHYPEWFPFLPLPPLPAIYGLDPAGEIVAVGSHVGGLKPGQRVYVNPARSCGACIKCRRGDTVSCSSFTLAGYFGCGPGSKQVFERYPSGGFAEYMIAPASAIVTLPDEVTFEQASRFGYLGTSYAALCHAQAGPQTSVLINGATGTLGVGATLLALAMGVPKILAVARNEALLSELKALDPKRIITYSTKAGPCTDWARENTDGFGPDCVIEALGPDAPPEATMAAIQSVSRGGRIVTVGGMDKELPISPIWLMVNQISYIGSAWFTTAQGQDMAVMAQSGTLDLSRLEQQCFELDQVNHALDAAHHRERGGFINIVVKP
ncbi:D-arabinose 1-dehydrogenase, Zn-dependent alcohol dehydrogenase family [Pseudomonas cuatrocienegasensis]|uniref:D-arabinose 1-dehydrogenase, Zn-dependent alcohol dehydrogenase family n=1 Tax=Pseudomonas cuatrocienegasensis TaxID=543360 RepID=A0ABY1BME9_9PSED|nr:MULTISPECIES: alcohol dehydrogenase catalytic domain-containing protein [Pseudomonas]OEC34408.1 alcohol dehydrogenase [Pseudomonas sp. 21C1]SER18733.1 D-arabinose 1-dehydrogenase, Zn-dependent alcohol dehydrogenase family [Pseudomonas cuatrocienegasensis]